MELDGIFRVILSFAFVIALMLSIAWVARRLELDKKLGNRKVSSQTANLAIENTLYLDQKNRLVIISRDNKRHLVLIGASSNILIETYDAKNEHDVATSSCAENE